MKSASGLNHKVVPKLYLWKVAKPCYKGFRAEFHFFSFFRLRCGLVWKIRGAQSGRKPKNQIAEMNEEPLSNEQLAALYNEREAIGDFLTPPKPDPAEWPPRGWQVHPANPDFLVRTIRAEDLREELFGSPRLTEWRKRATVRLAEINARLTAHFFPKKKEEGTQRKTLSGFVATIETGLERIVDETALPSVLKKCPKGLEDLVIKWKASLKLKEYRNLPEDVQTLLEPALIVRPAKETFDIVKIPD